MVTDIDRADKGEKESTEKIKETRFLDSVTFPPSELQDWGLQHVVGHDFFKVSR